MQDGGFRSCRLNHKASDSKTSWHQAGLRQIRKRKCGHSLMVKFQPSKLAMRVRFPLPALPFCWIRRFWHEAHRPQGEAITTDLICARAKHVDLLPAEVVERENPISRKHEGKSLR